MTLRFFSLTNQDFMDNRFHGVVAGWCGELLELKNKLVDERYTCLHLGCLTKGVHYPQETTYIMVNNDGIFHRKNPPIKSYNIFFMELNN